MPQEMRNTSTEPMAAQGFPGQLAKPLPGAFAWSVPGNGALLCSQDGFMHPVLPVAGRADNQSSRNVGPVAVRLNSKLQHHQVSVAQPSVRGMVRHSVGHGRAKRAGSNL